MGEHRRLQAHKEQTAAAAWHIPNDEDLFKSMPWILDHPHSRSQRSGSPRPGSNFPLLAARRCQFCGKHLVWFCHGEMDIEVKHTKNAMSRNWVFVGRRGTTKRIFAYVFAKVHRLLGFDTSTEVGIYGHACDSSTFEMERSQMPDTNKSNLIKITVRPVGSARKGECETKLMHPTKNGAIFIRGVHSAHAWDGARPF